MRKAYLYVGIALVLMSGPVSLLAQQKRKVAILVSDEAARTYFEIHYPTCKKHFQTEVCGEPTLWESGYLGAHEYQRYYQGWIYALGKATSTEAEDEEQEISFSRISDRDLTEEGLKGYGVLILSNTPSISDESARAIRQWVIRGGRLIATFGAGYKQIVDTDKSAGDTMKLQEGGTNGLHQLWKDPLSKMVSSGDLACTTDSLLAGDKTCCKDWRGDYPNCDTCAGVDVRISRYDEGPTKRLAKLLVNTPAPEDDGLLDYRGMGNLMVQRPESSDKVLAFLKFQNTDYNRPSPAIIVSDHAKGRVVYFAFAPEFDVSLKFGLFGLSECCEVEGEEAICEHAYSNCVEPLKPYYWGNVDAMMLLMRDTVRWLRDID